MKRISIALLLSLAFAIGAVADDATVNKASDFDARMAGIKRVAIVPIEPCPASLECTTIERTLFIDFRAAWKPQAILTSQTRQKMFELGITSLNNEAFQQLADALEVDALLVPAITYVGSKLQPASLITPAGQAPEARVQLELFTPGVALPIFRGTKQGQATTMSMAEGLTSRLYKGILKKVFPKR